MLAAHYQYAVPLRSEVPPQKSPCEFLFEPIKIKIVLELVLVLEAVYKPQL